MKIGLINLEPKYTNIALEKLRMYYTLNGHEVLNITPIEIDTYDKVYASSIFDFTCKSYIPTNVIVGGTGFDLTIKLPEEIECMKPKLNKGFTMRGCIRKCPFCVVPLKEGIAKPMGDIYDLWDGKSKEIILFDNNILALPEHFKLICNQLRKEKLKVDWNQGLDMRLLDNDNINILKSIKIKVYRFSFDDINQEKNVLKTLNLLKKHGIRNQMWYILIAFNSTFKEDMKRVQLIKKHKMDCFIMIYNNIGTKLQREMARWNNRFYFRGIQFEDYLKAKKQGYLLDNNK